MKNLQAFVLIVSDGKDRELPGGCRDGYLRLTILSGFVIINCTAAPLMITEGDSV